MPDRAPSETTNLDRYGNDAPPWSRPRDLLAAGPAQPGTTFFLATTRPDGRPHAAGVGVGWHEGDLYFNSGPMTRKARNLAADSACVISVALEGIDLILEGDATIVDDPQLMETLAAQAREAGWPVEVKDGRLTAPFRAPTGGAAAVGLLPVQVPHGVWRGDGGAIRRDSMAVQIRTNMAATATSEA